MRGVTYIVWGSFHRGHLQRSMNSHDYPTEVIEVDSQLPGLGKKAEMSLTSFNTCCYLDTDTQVYESLDFGFEMAEKYGIAVCHAPACSAYHAQPNAVRHLCRNLPQLNTGVIFFDITQERVQQVFDMWYELCKQPEAAMNDQPPFSVAVYEHLNPFILPRTWNYRTKIRYEGKPPHGPIIIEHAK